MQAVAAVFLVLGLALHVTEVGFVGLAITIVVTACNGITEEHELGDAFLEAMPFVSLLVVFFGVVAIIQDQAIFEPIIDGVLELDPGMQPGVLFVTNGAHDVLYNRQSRWRWRFLSLCALSAGMQECFRWSQTMSSWQRSSSRE